MQEIHVSKREQGTDMTVIGTTAPKTTVPPTTPEEPKREPVEGSSGQEHGIATSFMNAITLSGLVVRDAAHFAGIESDPKQGGPGVKPVNIVTLTGVNAGIAAAVAVHQRDKLNIAGRPTFSEGIRAAGTNALKVTPTLVSAIAGPAIADGISYIAPKFMPKYKKEMKPAEKTKVQAFRFVAGALAVGGLAGLAFLIKPSLFKKAGFISEATIASMGGGLVEGKLTKTVADSVFSNRMITGLAGGVAGVWALNKAVDSDRKDQKLWMGITAGIVAATAGAYFAVPKLTHGAEGAIGAAFLPQDKALFFKPNMNWLKDYGSKVAPYTTLPAGMSASTYFDIVSDFETITSPKSPFNK